MLTIDNTLEDSSEPGFSPSAFSRVVAWACEIVTSVAVAPIGPTIDSMLERGVTNVPFAPIDRYVFAVDIGVIFAPVSNTPAVALFVATGSWIPAPELPAVFVPGEGDALAPFPYGWVRAAFPATFRSPLAL